MSRTSVRLAQSDDPQGDDEMDTSLAIGLIVAAFGAGYVVAKKGPGSEPLPPPAEPDRAALDAVRSILAAEGKIAAIKAYREKTGTGLRDAKFAVDTLE